jgi:4-amino-4-deoxy-L-arabinose transferase-like glycosyltransferase
LLELFGAASGFYVAHLVSIALIGALSAATYLLARGRLSIRTSALIAVAASTLPVVIQQSADVYLDLPLAVITTLACWATARRRFWLTVGLVFVGVAIKTSAVFLLPLILMARPLKRPVRTHVVYAALAGVLAFLPFLPAFLTTERFDTGVTFATQRTLLQSSISMLVLTVDVFLVMAIFVLVV